LHHTAPSGQMGSAYLAAVVGTQMTMNRRSATERLSMRRLVAVRARRYSDTTSTTTRLPTNPMSTIRPNSVGTAIPISCSNELSFVALDDDDDDELRSSP